MLNKEHSIIITRNSLPGGSCEEVPPVPATVAGRRYWVSQAICSGENGAGSPLAHPFVLGLGLRATVTIP